MDGTGETAAQRVTDLEAQLAAARDAAAAEAAAGAAPAEQQAAATDAAAQAGANDAQAAQAGAQAVAEQEQAPAVAPGDGTRPQDGQAPGTAEGTGAIQAAPSPSSPSSPANPTGQVPAVPAAEGTAGDQHASVIDLVKQAHDEAVQAGEGAQPGQHHFVEVLRNVAGRLVEDGRIVEADLLTPAESGRVHATLIKLVGELVGKL